MTRTIQPTYRYRRNPTIAQAQLLNQFAGARRFGWNWALHRMITHYQQTGTTLGFAALSAELTLRNQQPETAWLRAMDAQSLPQVLWELERAYQQFFRRVKKGAKHKGQ